MSQFRKPSGDDPAVLRALFSHRSDSAAPYATRPAASLRHDTDLSPESQHLLQAWKAWRGHRLLPRRRDMDLVSICRLMPALALLEVISPNRAMIRLAGGDIEALVGQKLMGRDYVALADPALRTERGTLLWTAATQPAGLVSFHLFPHPAGGTHQSQTCGLPILPDEENAPVQILAVVSRLPDLRHGTRMSYLQRLGHQRHFLDIGAGLPSQAA